MRVSLPEPTIWIVGLGVTIGLATGGVGPWIVGKLVETGGFTLEQASLMATLEQGAQGVTMIALAPLMSRLPRRATMLVSLALILLTQFGSMVITSFPAMAVMRSISGIGFGAIYAIATALGASTKVPDRTFAFAQTLTFASAILLNPMLGFGASLYHHQGVFLAIGSYCALFGLPLAWLVVRGGATSLTPPAATIPRGPLRLGVTLGVLVAISLFSIASAGAWVFMERIATSVGIGSAALGTGLIGTSIVALIGSSAATWLGLRAGRVLPFVGGMVALAVVTTSYMNAGSAVMFWLSMSLWVIVYGFANPYIFGLAAAADPSGRVSALAGSAFVLVSAAGVSISAAIAARFGMGGFGATAIALYLGTALIGWLVMQALRTGAIPDAAKGDVDALAR